MPRPATGKGSVFWRSLGPGLFWAAAAIGVSHLVQSTRAGASGGFALTGVILLALILKYPFFEFGPRYAAATGESLVEGYRRIGRWALWLYFLITVLTAPIVILAIVLFTSFLLRFALALDGSLSLAGGTLYAGCALILWLGRFRALDWTVKLIMLLLAVSTLAAAIVALPRSDFSSLGLGARAVADGTVPFAFLLALVGWMPSAIDISVWSSLWTLAKDRAGGVRTSVRHALLDFRIGYVGTGTLAFCFLTLGATIMYGTGERFSPRGTVFSTQLVELYSETLGAWLEPVVLVAVVTTMLSTSLTVVDGFPRAIDRSLRVLIQGTEAAASGLREVGRAYWTAIVVLGVITVVVLAFFIGSLTAMVDFATIVSFITAPVLGWLNLTAVTSTDVPERYRPGPTLLWLSRVGLLLLGGTAVVYLLTWVV